MTKTVYVGMSGGVDSSVTAALLKEQGYNVVGVYMKNWSQDLPGFACPWKEDYQDAKRVAVQLGIPFKMYDFETEYRHKVVDYMLDGYKAGITPNPDIMCNQEVKFKLFLETALEDGADMIATGHYAVTKDGKLLKAKDDNKDQTYFLYRVEASALEKTLFPLGGFAKPEVRQMAIDRGLVTASKKDSQGICFVGKVGIKEFLAQFVKTKPGKIVEASSGYVLGEHDGAVFYTLGQRHGLEVGGGLPYYVVGKDMTKNEVYVSTDLNNQALWNKELKLASVHWINQAPKSGHTYQVRIRHRGELIGARVISDGQNSVIELDEPQRAVAPGQSAVVYDGMVCLGGGIII